MTKHSMIRILIKKQDGLWGMQYAWNTSFKTGVPPMRDVLKARIFCNQLNERMHERQRSQTV